MQFHMQSRIGPAGCGQRHGGAALPLVPPPPRRRPPPHGCAHPQTGGRHRHATTPAAATAGGAPTAAVGIDLGTTNSVVAVLRAGDAAPCVLRADGGGALPPAALGAAAARTGPNAASNAPSAAFTIPSVVTALEDGNWIVGDAARRRAASDPLNTFYSVKRLIGRAAAEVGPVSQYVYGTAAAPDGGVRIVCPARGGTLLRPEEVSAEVLRHAVGLAARHLDAPVTEAVVTIPAYFTQQQRAATLQAARLSGLERVSLLQEPVAAALAFGFGKPEEAETVVVFDLGGGTYDVSVLDSFEGIMEVLATAGDSQLGGDDFDRSMLALLTARLADAAAAAVAGSAAAAAGAPTAAAVAAALASDPAASAALLATAEAAKIRLSSIDTVDVPPPPEVLAALAKAFGGLTGGLTGQTLAVRVTADDLVNATAALRARLWPPLASAAVACKLALPGTGEGFEAQLLKAQGAAMGAVNSSSSGSGSSNGATAVPADKYAPRPRMATAAVLVGGATRSPVVRGYVQHVTGLEPRYDVDPEQAVALGAAVQAGLLLGLTSGVEVMDGSYVADLHSRASGFQV